MPYLIETYAKDKDKNLRLINIDTEKQFDSIETANIRINELLADQKEDNEYLMNCYAERLRSQLMDIDTDDTIISPPTQFNYTYKAKNYSKRAINKIP